MKYVDYFLTTIGVLFSLFVVGFLLCLIFVVSSMFYKSIVTEPKATAYCGKLYREYSVERTRCVHDILDGFKTMP